MGGGVCAVMSPSSGAAVAGDLTLQLPRQPGLPPAKSTTSQMCVCVSCVVGISSRLGCTALIQMLHMTVASCRSTKEGKKIRRLEKQI